MAILDLRAASGQILAVVTASLEERRPTWRLLGDAMAIAAVPTEPLASGEERRKAGADARAAAEALLCAGGTCGSSISHTRGVSAAVSVASSGRVGLDIEQCVPSRPRIARRVLTKGELQRLPDPPP